MELNANLLSRIKKKHRLLAKNLLGGSDDRISTEDLETQERDSLELDACDKVSEATVLVPETPSPVFSRITTKREREDHLSSDEDSDSKRTRAVIKDTSHWSSTQKVTDLENDAKKDAYEKLRAAQEKRDAQINQEIGASANASSSIEYELSEVKQDPRKEALEKLKAERARHKAKLDSNEEKGASAGAANTYRYSHYGTGYLGWPSESSESSSDDDFFDSVPLRSILQNKQIMASSAKAVDKNCKLNVLNQTKKVSNVSKSSKERNSVSESDSRNSARGDNESLKFKTEIGKNGSEVHLENETCNLENQSKNRKRLFVPKNFRSELKPKSSDTRFDSRSEQFFQSAENNGHNISPLDLPSCRFANVNTFKSLASPNISSNNDGSVLISSSPTCSKSNHPTELESHPLSQELDCFQNLHPDSERYSTSSESDEACIWKARSSCQYDKSNNVSADLRLSDNSSGNNHKDHPGPSESCFTSNNAVDLSPGNGSTCRFSSNIDKNGSFHISSSCHFSNAGNIEAPIVVDSVAAGLRSSSPDVIHMGIYSPSSSRHSEFDITNTLATRNRAGTRRRTRVSGLRRNRAVADSGILPTSSRLNNDASTGAEAEEALTLVRQIEDDEEYARKLQEEMDKEFAMSLHQADAGFEQPQDAGFCAEDSLCSVALSPTFMQHCRSPFRRRGYHSNRQPGTRSRRRGGAAAEPDDMLFEELHDEDLPHELMRVNQHSPRRFPFESNHPLAFMEAHILALLENSPVQRRGRRRGSGGRAYRFNVYSPMGEGNDYEELLQLAEQLGEVKKRGINKTEINRLPTRTFTKQESPEEENGDCLICMCEYENGELMRILPCFHEFHSGCVDQWLKTNATCPICREEVKMM